MRRFLALAVPYGLLMGQSPTPVGDYLGLFRGCTTPVDVAIHVAKKADEKEPATTSAVFREWGD